MKFKKYLKERKGSFLDNQKLPKEGQTVYAIVGFNNKIVKGKVTRLTNIDNKGLSNTYLNIDVNGKNYHLSIDQIYDHIPKKVKIKDEYGETTIWEDISIPVEVGDTILGGRFKNKKIIVKSIEYNERGEPLINGKPLMKYRLIPKEIEDEV